MLNIDNEVRANAEVLPSPCILGSLLCSSLGSLSMGNSSFRAKSMLLLGCCASCSNWSIRSETRKQKIR